MNMTASDSQPWSGDGLTVDDRRPEADSGSNPLSVQRFSGSVDIQTAADFASTLDRVAAGSTDGVLLDLTRLHFFGTAGLSLLAEFARVAHQRGLPFAVVAGRVAARPIEACGLTPLVPLYDSLDEASEGLCRT